MEITKYSKKTWIITLAVALFSIILDALTLTGVFGTVSSSTLSMSKMTLVIGLLGVYYSVRGILYHVKKEKEDRQ